MSRKQISDNKDQLELPGLNVKPSRPMRPTLQRIQALLEKRSHWAPPGKRSGAPRVYAFSGSMKQLKAHPDKLPRCPAFYATKDIFGHFSPQLSGDAVAQWSLHGEHKPQPGDRFYAFSVPHQDWIGAGTLYREGADTLALLEEGSFQNFARFEHDARGLILVFTTGGILR